MSSESDTLYNAVRNSDKILLTPSEDKYLIGCCISEKWCFDHTGIASIREYDKNINNCCICLEFRRQKMLICSKQTNCYLCCCVIYFT